MNATFAEPPQFVDETRQPRGLIVEDNVAIALDMIAVLQDYGVDDVVWVRTGEAAIAECRTGSFDFAVFDLVLVDGATGAETAAHLATRIGKLIIFSGTTEKAIPELSSIPHVFVPKTGQPEIIAEILGLRNQKKGRASQAKTISRSETCSTY